MEMNELMIQVNKWIKEILKDNYVGVYFHGSLRLGSFNPNKSRASSDSKKLTSTLIGNSFGYNHALVYPCNNFVKKK
jgi:streptomycin 3"-adenylyltransferase